MLVWVRAVLIGMVMLTAGMTLSARAWEPRESARVFFFGNSLINHLSETTATTVPYWLALLAQHGGKDFAAEGHWGFPRNFAADLPPKKHWYIREVAPVQRQEGAIRGELFDSYILSVENFIQGIPPTHPYQGDNPEGESPVDVILTVLDWIDANSPGARFFLYEGWAGFSEKEAFPPGAEALARHRDDARGAYHDWYLDLVAALGDARPGRAIELIPVSIIMAEVLDMPELAGLAPEALYSDRAPHGTPTTYLLASMITYAAIFGERPPSGFPVAEGIAPEFGRNYEVVADRIWHALNEAGRN